MSESSPTNQPIAVVGASALFPGSSEARGFWRDILAGRDLVTDVPASHWLIEDYYDPDPSAPDKTYCKRGAFLDPVEFDCMQFGMPPNLLKATDTTQLLSLIVAQQVLSDATDDQFQHIDKSKVSVILGATGATELVVHLGSRLQRPLWLKALRDSGIEESEAQSICQKIADSYVPWQEASFPGLLGNVVAGRIANRFDLGGTNCVVDAACASSQSALFMALNELYNGQSDLCITGGVDTLNDILMYMCFSKTPALSPSGDCRPFSDRADGTILGEGLGMIALRRLEDAEREGDRIYAVIRGMGSSSDGRSLSVYAPRSEGQAKALRRAYDAAGYGPSTVELVEAHGTGTKAGDVAEINGLKMVFDPNGDNPSSDKDTRPWCALGSVKSQIGHTKAAAGAASLFKAIMALHHKVLPPTIKVDRPNPKLELDKSPFYINTKARPWIRDGAHPRRASVSSFGFGGSNFHVTLEEYTGTSRKAYRYLPGPSQLILASAPALGTLLHTCRGFVGKEKSLSDLEALARQTHERFDAKAEHRLAFVASSFEQLSQQVEQACRTLEAGTQEAVRAPSGWMYAKGEMSGETAFLFPGQGSQYVEMGGSVAMAFDSAREVWDRAADCQWDDECRLHDVVFPQPCFDQESEGLQAQHLTRTEWAQPAIGATSLALLSVLKDLGLRADCMGGHSFGEITALHAAGVLSEKDFFAVARKRGELMARASSREGAMTAVSHSADQVRSLLEEWGSDVVMANHNSPKQVVLSGAVQAIDDVEAKLGQHNIAFKRLPVSTAFHSPLVSDACEGFGQFLGDVTFESPSVPVYANVSGEKYEGESTSFRQTVTDQIANPVLFTEQIQAMYEAGVRTFVEIGPGRVLTRLVAETLGSQPHRAVSLDQRGSVGLEAFWSGLAELAVAGVELELGALWGSIRPLEAKEENAKKLGVPVSGVNVEKPYPPEGGAAALPAPIAKKARPKESPQPRSVVTASGSSGARASASMEPPRRVEAPVQTKVATDPVVRAQGPKPQHMVRTMIEEARPEAPKTEDSRATQANLGPSPMHGDEGPWVRAFQDLQRNTADAHMAFLSFAEKSLDQLDALAHGRPAAVSSNGTTRAPKQNGSAPVVHRRVEEVSSPRPSVTESAPPRAPEAAPPPLTNGTPTVEAKPEPAPPTHANGAANNASLVSLILDVVADKTGYPVEMLDMSMDMESDLGIDSIKRVEILSAVQEKAPELPELDPSALGTLRTLEDIVGSLGEGAPAHVASEAPAVAQPSGSQPGLDVKELTETMLAVVADKTGYPQDMLEPSMDLESDLGVDSIKRVEILSAVKERVPSLPEIDPSELGRLRTLGDIVEALHEGDMSATPAPTSQSSNGAATKAPASSSSNGTGSSSNRTEEAHGSVDLHGIMMEVVSEKTGYPIEMIDADMDLESDLGIDSIKRVEILSAMTERVPSLPALDPSELASLRTLGDIARKYGSESPVGPSSNGGAHSSTSNGTHRDEVESPRAEALTIGRYAVEWVSEEPPGLTPSSLEGRTLFITDDGSGIAKALADSLSRRGCEARVGAEPPADADAVISLDALRPANDIDEALSANRRVYTTAISLAKTLSAKGGVFVTVQDGRGQAWASGTSGLAKTCALEWPEALVRVIDLDRGTRDARELGDALAEELLFGGTALEVSLAANGERLIPRCVEEPIDPASFGEKNSPSVLVASGGARGVTAACLIELARRHGCHIALLGRTALQPEPACCSGLEDDAAIKKALLDDARSRGEKPNPRELGALASKIRSQREIQNTLKSLRDAGAECDYFPCDVVDADSVSAVCQDVRDRWGPIDGLVHGAGVLADKLLVEKTVEQFDRVFDTKVRGLKALLEATREDSLKTIVLFSSVAGRFGNAGQSDYAMANEVLNRVAESESSRRGGSSIVKSVDWGPWKSGMVDANLEKKFEALGVALIPLDEGARYFVDELADEKSSRVEVVIGGSPENGLSGQDSAKAFRFHIRVDAETYPYLESHQVDDVPVLPLVTVHEWFVRAARAMRGERLGPIRCQDLRVLKGVRLSNFRDVGHRFDVVGTWTKPLEEAQVVLLDDEGQTRYSAKVGFLEPEASSTSPPNLDLPEVKIVGQGLYGKTLFHGEQFAGVVEIDRMGEGGVEATLRGSMTLNWPHCSWKTDPALLDSGLQLARVWGFERLSQPTLPTSFVECVQYREGLIPNDTRCVVRGELIGKTGLRLDLWFVDLDGNTVAEIRGLEHYVTREPVVSESL